MIHLKNISTRWFLLISSICYNKTILFQLVAFKIHAIIKTAYCVNWLPWTSSGSSHWEVFLEIDLNQKTLKFYTSWEHWKSQCRSTIRKHAVMEQAMNVNTDIFVKNIFNPFHGTEEDQRLPDVFRGHWKRPVTWNELRVI